MKAHSPGPHRFEPRDDTHPDACKHCDESARRHPIFTYDSATNAWLKRLDENATQRA